MLDYRDAISVGGCFSDPELASSTPRTNQLGFPWGATGGNASVYQLAAAGRSWAVRCFVKPLHPSTARRYAAISNHLKAARLPYATEFDYLPEGIQVEGRRYPVVKMAWIEGSNLNDYVQHLVVSGDREGLYQLRHRWEQMLVALEAAKVAHGDLQHGNVR